MTRCLIASAITAAICLMAPNAADSAAVGIWLLDENGGTTAMDSSGMGNHGALVGGATWAAGKFGSAIHVDGATGAVDCGNDASLHIPQGTMMCWSMSDGIVGNTGQSAVTLPYDNGEAWDGPWRTLGLGIWDNQLRYWLAINGQNSEMQPGTIDANVWYHMAVTYDGETARSFLDGEEVASSDNAGALEYGDPKPSCIIGGRSLAAPGEWFKGSVTEVAIFDETLSAGEIAEIMADGLAATTVTDVSLEGKLATSWASVKTALAVR